MFSLRTLIIFAIYAAVLYFGRRLEQQLSRHNNPRPGLILPVLAVILAAALSFRNFWIAWDVEFSLFAFLAAVALFVFFAVPAIYFILLYVEGRKEVRARKVARSMRVRQAKTQQRVQPNLQQRYESPLVKQEPIVYMPSNRSNSNARTTRRPITTSRTARSTRSAADKRRR
ncbi:MAG: hypothetical protein UDB11_02340 [Peptococcaceae bacterium]|nr:hypothetical protein [Peptococcaceae bacterium]